MSEKPILFSAPMVRAVLAGTKTQTRRALRVQPPANTVQVSTWHHPDQRPMFYAWTRAGGPVADHLFGGAEISDWEPVPCPYGKPGDRLWVREAFAGSIAYERHGYPLKEWGNKIWYIADGEPRSGQWTLPRPSIHMPRALSRITLEVTGVRVERLQAISATDAIAEGVNVHADHHGKPRDSIYSPVQAYRDLWEQINGPGSWDANPWVWVVEFRRLPTNQREGA